MSTVREQAIEAGADKLSIRTGYPLSTARAVVIAVVDAVEPILRADLLREFHVDAHVWRNAPGRKECLCPHGVDHDESPVDLWEEFKRIIRADERDEMVWDVQEVEAEVRERLRAQVEALRREAFDKAKGANSDREARAKHDGEGMAFGRVLDLLGGESNG
jgi:hypothetical protein